MVEKDQLGEILVELLAKVGEGTGLRSKIKGLKDNPHKNPLFRRLVREELNEFLDNLDLDLRSDYWEGLLVQSVQGRAQNGHGAFGRNNVSYPNIGIPDIIKAAGININKAKRKRQKLIDDVYQWTDLALDKRVNRLVLKGRPLLGVDMLRDYKVDIESTLKGMVLAGYMDNYEWRQRTVSHFERTIKGDELIIGGGETYLIDPDMLTLACLGYGAVAQEEFEDHHIEYLRELGVILDRRDQCKKTEGAYFRRKNGPGVSDDLAFIMIGKLIGYGKLEKGVSAMLGAFVVDAIDTYDKCVMYPESGGLDEGLADYIQAAWEHEHGKPLVSPEEIMTVIYYGAKSNNPKVSASSSHRRLIEYNGTKKYLPTMGLHIRFLEGEQLEEFPVGFTRMKSSTFYSRAETRSLHMLKNPEVIPLLPSGP
jgi:hypothetical protein